jgi:hypothetical protein
MNIVVRFMPSQPKLDLTSAPRRAMDGNGRRKGNAASPMERTQMQKPKANKRGKSSRTRRTAGRSKPKRRAKNSVSRIPRGSGEPELHSRLTKAAKIQALLKQSGGATLQGLMVATGWQAHSVRGFISGHLLKRLRIHVQSLRRDGERVYKIES